MHFILLLFCFVLLIEAKKKKLRIKKIKTKKPKPIKVKPIKIKPIHSKAPKIKTGKKHKKKQKINQAIVPMFSPGFNGTDTGQVPADFQVQLIEDWLKRIRTVCDFFLNMVQVQEDIEDQRQVIRSIFPPVRVLLEADYAHSVYLQNQNDPALLAAQSMATQTASFSFTYSPTYTASYYPGYVTDTF